MLVILSMSTWLLFSFNCWVVVISLWPHGLQHKACLPFTVSWSLLKLMSTESVMPSNHLILCCPLLLHTQSFPTSRSFQMSQCFTSGGQSIRVSASTLVLPMNTQDWSPLGGLAGSPCSPRDSQESSPTPEFKSVNPLVLSLLYGPNHICIHDYWENHSFDYMDLHWQNNVSAF